MKILQVLHWKFKTRSSINQQSRKNLLTTEQSELKIVCNFLQSALMHYNNLLEQPHTNNKFVMSRSTVIVTETMRQCTTAQFVETAKFPVSIAIDFS